MNEYIVADVADPLGKSIKEENRLCEKVQKSEDMFVCALKQMTINGEVRLL